MKKITFISIILFLSIISWGQNNSTKSTGNNDATIVFNETIHDFGEILAGSGKATCEFTFTNKGTEPIIISKAKASCGCTVPKWTKEPVMPGETGTVEVTYTSTKIASSKPFTKSITITSNGQPSTLVLLVKGLVVSELSPYSKAIINQEELNFEYKRKPVCNTIEILNDGNAPLNITDISTPEYISVIPSANPIAPQDKITLNITVNPKGKKIIDENIIIKTDSSKTPELTIKIKGHKK